jgi:hypothetical protein
VRLRIGWRWPGSASIVVRIDVHRDTSAGGNLNVEGPVNSIRVVHSGPRPEQSFQVPEDLATRAEAAIVYALSRKASRAGVSKATLRCCGPEILPKKLS